MRCSLALIAVLAVALPGAAAAQSAEAEPPAEGGPSEMDFLPAAGDERPRDFGGAPSGEVSGGIAPESHTVERGDTLWDISGTYLDNPWYWPKVWSYNPQIENPHWIYPGDEIRLQQGEAGVAAQGGELPELSRGTWDNPGDDDVSVAGRIGVRLPTNLLAPSVGFVTEEELAASGTLAKSWEEKALLMEGDRIYIEWEEPGSVQVGDSHVIYRTDREIAHPEGGSAGYLTRILGTAKVVEMKPGADYATAMIVRSLSEIERGDRIGPVAGGALFRRIGRSPNQAEVQGHILATLEENLAELGQGHLVFLDRGREDGLAEGNTLDVVRAGDGLDDDGYTPYYDEELPRENIGSLMVVDVKEKTAAAVVVRSIRELRIGDRVEMVAAN